MKKMKLLFILSGICGLLLICLNACAQEKASPDSLLRQLRKEQDDSNKVNTLIELSKTFMNDSSDKAREYAMEALNLSDKIEYSYGQAKSLKTVGIAYYMAGQYVDAAVYWHKSYKIFEKIGDKGGESNILSNLGVIYSNIGADPAEYYEKALQLAAEVYDTFRIVTALNNLGTYYLQNSDTNNIGLQYFLRAIKISEHTSLRDSTILYSCYINTGDCYSKGSQTDSALYFYQQALRYTTFESLPYLLNDIGKLYLRKRSYEKAFEYYTKGYEAARKSSSDLDIIQSLTGIGRVMIAKGENAEGLNKLKQAQKIAEVLKANLELKIIYKDISDAYMKMNKPGYANSYLNSYISIQDTIASLNQRTIQESQKQITALKLNSKEQEIDKLTQESATKNKQIKSEKNIRYVTLTGLAMMLLFSIGVVRQRNKVKKEKKRAEEAFTNLKFTQAQLIQSEKMASLGELTAGIAHEIQNPLNFVNNFSEVNKELIGEMKDELKAGNNEEAIAIANDLETNLEKINHHGKRADSIVKGMLQHSRVSTGQKEPTDINALADEYLRLSYHGMRAKDKEFNATIKTNFDKEIGNISIIPQDIGRVLLNLYNNAFYALAEKMKLQFQNFEPTISVSTKKVNDRVEISLKDNGNGIPQNIVDKIFQPFFTTKPTGQGTGLGLSLSYDIIKAHGGEITVESKEGEGSVFNIQIPILS